MKFSSILLCASSVDQSEKDADYRPRPSSNPRSSARCHGFRRFLRVFGEAKLNDTKEKLRVETRAYWKLRFFSPEVDSPQKKPRDRPTSDANRDVLNAAYERAFDSVRSHSTMAILEGADHGQNPTSNPSPDNGGADHAQKPTSYPSPDNGGVSEAVRAHVYADVLQHTRISVPRPCGRTLARTHDVPDAHGEAASDKAPKKPPRRKRVYRSILK